MIALCGIVTWMMFLLSTDGEFAKPALIGSAITAPIGVYYWMWDSTMGDGSWGDWIGMFFVGFMFSVFCLFVDCGWKNPFQQELSTCTHGGISMIITLSAVILAVISLPGALRAWLLLKLA